MNDPFFSIIIPTFNRAGLLSKTIESVLLQQFANFELIVVDDGSTDNTQEVVLAIKDDRIVYRNKENKERAAARNFGLKLARGNYVTFLDSDDILYPTHLEFGKKKLEALGEPEVYHQGYQVVNEAGKVISQMKLTDSSLNRLLFTKGNVMSCMGVFLKKGIALEHPFNEDIDLIGVEDWELWIRLAGKFTIHHDSTITGAIVNHDDRSVMHLNENTLVKRMSALMSYVNGIEILNYKYRGLKKVLEANTLTYISLHLSEWGSQKQRALHYLLRATRRHAGVLLERRTWAIIRNIFLR